MATRLIETGNIDIEAIKDQHPLAEVVEQYVQLRRRAGKLEGLCPFHDERSPSFKIYEKDQRYHCFGCGAHGDVFDFLEHIAKLDLRAAAEHLTGGTYPTYTPDRIEELRAKRAAFEAQEVAARAKVVEACRARWDAAVDADIHPYLIAKGIQAHGARIEPDGSLLTPLVGQDGRIQCVQSIRADGGKQFPYRGSVTGGFYVMGGKVVAATEPVILCEGFATAASLQEATGRVVICTYNGANMLAVAGFFAKRYPNREFLVAGDNDHSKKDNPGLRRANEAAAILRCAAIVPAWPQGSSGTDFNDMAASYGLEAVRALVADGVVPNGAEVPQPDIFTLLDLDELEALPPPTWLINELIADHGLSIVYGDPGAGKSFIVLDMAMRLAFGMDWHGVEAQRCGVLYIAGEGSRGLGKRVKGWRREHALEGVDAPFLLLPVAVQLLDPQEREKLFRTIDAAMARAGFAVGLVVIDTVSRAIAGQDENGQEAMSLLVGACGDIQNRTGGAVIGVHHSGKDSSRGMRGSTVLLGGCDASLKITKDENGQTVTIEVEKQKDAEEADPFYMTLKKVEWSVGLGKEESTLVPEKSGRPISEQKTISRRQADEIFRLVEAAWANGNPWSAYPQSKRKGRYLIDHIVREYGVTARVAEDHVTGWQSREYMKSEKSSPNKGAGLRILRYLEAE